MTALLAVPGAQALPDSEGRTPLMWAAQRGNYSVLKAMLERQVDVHACDKLSATGESQSSTSICHATVSVPSDCLPSPACSRPRRPRQLRPAAGAAWGSGGRSGQ